jgi:hypothetical protein
LSGTSAPAESELKENWKQAMFGEDAGNAAVSGDALDPDGDGLTNQQEFYANTDPLDADDRFEMQTFQSNSGVSFQLTVPGKAGRRYVMERTPTLQPVSWTGVDSTSVLSADGEVVLTDSAPPSDQAFYRARVELP